MNGGFLQPFQLKIIFCRVQSGFIYKKKIISQYIFAGASALNFIFLCYFLINSIKNVEFHFPISYVLWLPLIYGNFRYAFFSHNIWGENVKLKSIKMLPTTFVVLVVCYLAFLRTDEQKYREFNNLCSEKANEILYATSSSNSVYIDYYPWGDKVGTASLPVIEKYYYSSHLAEILLSGSNKMNLVQLVYDIPSGKAVKSCVGKYVINATNKEEALRIPPCNKLTPIIYKSLSQYHVKFVYYKPNFQDIRRFEFLIIDEKNNKILARQNSFQLLLGDMSPNKKELYGWGSSQGAEVCKLTPPSNFIRNALPNITP